MFDFTSLYHSEHAAKIYERRGRRLLATVVGDSLLEVWVSLILKCALSCIEWFSFECRKTKTKVITLANHIGYR